MLARRLSLVAWSVWALSPLWRQTDWPVYGHDPGGMRYSPLKQITAKNVAKLRVAWTCNTLAPLSDTPPTVVSGAGPGAAAGRGTATRPRLSEATPLVVGDVMYVGTSYNRVLAFDAESRSGANSWGFITVDVERGMLFAPVGTPTKMS